MKIETKITTKAIVTAIVFFVSVIGMVFFYRVMQFNEIEGVVVGGAYLLAWLIYYGIIDLWKADEKLKKFEQKL